MSPAIQGDYISDLDPLASITQLPGGLFEVEVLAGPVAGAYVTRRLTTEQLATYLGAGLGPNAEKSLLKEFRFYRKADRDADGYGGACFETDLDWSTCCGNTVCIIDFYRESDAEPFRNQRLVCVYDPTPTDPTHTAWVDGSFTGLRNPSKFVPEASLAAQLANVPVLDPAKTDYLAGTVVQYTIGGKVFLYKAVAAGGPFAAPTDPQGLGTADWQAVAAAAAGKLTQTHTLAFVQNLLATAPDFVPGLRYDLTGDWNGSGDPDQVVYVQAATATSFEAYGTLESGSYPNRVRTLVQVDVAAGTAVVRTYSKDEVNALLATKQGALVKSAQVNLNSGTYAMPRTLLGQRVLFYPVGATTITLPAVTLSDVGTVLAVTRGGGPGGGGVLTFTDSKSDSFALTSVGHTVFAEVVSLERGTPNNDTVASWVAVAEYGAGGKLYTALGQQTDGALTVKAATDELAKKANRVLRWPSLFSETILVERTDGGINTMSIYQSSVFQSDLRVNLPTSWSTDNVAALIYLRASAACTVTLATGRLDGQASVVLAAGEWRIIRGDLQDASSTDWATVLRGSVLTLGGGGGGGGAAVQVDGVTIVQAPDGTISAPATVEIELFFPLGGAQTVDYTFARRLQAGRYAVTFLSQNMAYLDIRLAGASQNSNAFDVVQGDMISVYAEAPVGGGYVVLSKIS